MRLNEIKGSKALTAEHLILSIRDGRFTLDGSDLEITGDFNCASKQLVSLKGGPRKVGGNFSCYGNALTSLEGGPIEVGGDYHCSWNLTLTSLRGAPRKVNGLFMCIFNRKLTSLEGGPVEVGGDFQCSNCDLISLKGAPVKVKTFVCSDNNIKSLEGAPRVIDGDFNCYKNKIKSLGGIHKRIEQINGVFNLKRNPVESHVLGLLLIDGLKAVELDNKDVERILNGFLPNTRGNAAVIDAQSALLDAGLEEFAQL